MQNKVNFMEIWMDVMRETQSENQMDTDFVPLINSHSNLICIDHECGDGFRTNCAAPVCKQPLCTYRMLDFHVLKDKKKIWE